jgi:CRISPR system Cascade subunit CasD
MRCLVFRLYGGMASWGEAATGEVRRTAPYPGRSAILGLVAAALGIPRTDQQRLDVLDASVSIAVKQVSPGELIQDYHTTQVPGRDRKQWRMTRRDELERPKEQLHTILSMRDYRCDGCWMVAVSVEEQTPWGCEAMQEALRYPAFALFLGRKSCPLGAPLAPQIVEAAGIQEALSTDFDPVTPLASEEEAWRMGRTGQVVYAWEGDGGDIEPQETRFPFDQSVSRSPWQFTSRPEHWQQTSEDT